MGQNWENEALDILRDHCGIEGENYEEQAKLGSKVAQKDDGDWAQKEFVNTLEEIVIADDADIDITAV